MIAVHWAPLYRRYYAPLFSGATVFCILSHAATIIFAFLIAYYTHGLWLKEASYREQPIVSYTHTCAVKLQGMRREGNNVQTPFEIVYSTIDSMNDIAENTVRIPILRVTEQDINSDLNADTIKIDLEFPIDESEGVSHVLGVFIFNYELRNRVRLAMQTPLLIDYAAGVPGRGVLIDGRLALKTIQALPLRPNVRGADLEPILPLKTRASGPEVSYERLVSAAMSRNDTVSLEPKESSWKIARRGCHPKCSFSLSLVVRIPTQQVGYVPSFVEVCKFSWIQFITTVWFLRLLIKPLLNFIMDEHIIQTIPRDPRKLEKFM